MIHSLSSIIGSLRPCRRPNLREWIRNQACGHNFNPAEETSACVRGERQRAVAVKLNIGEFFHQAFHFALSRCEDVEIRQHAFSLQCNIKDADPGRSVFRFNKVKPHGKRPRLEVRQMQ